MSRRDQAVEKALKLYTAHPDMTESNRLFYLSASSLVPLRVFERLPIDDGAAVLEAMRRTQDTTWRRAHDAHEPTTTFADKALDFLDHIIKSKKPLKHFREVALKLRVEAGGNS